MRFAIIALLLVSCAVQSQTNRSAAELARENIHEYLMNKIFKNKTYHPLTYGQLENYKQYDPEILWTLEHKFEIVQTVRLFGKDSSTVMPYKFVFYLDSKLKVYRADSFQGNLLLNEDRPISTVRRQ